MNVRSGVTMPLFHLPAGTLSLVRSWLAVCLFPWFTLGAPTENGGTAASASTKVGKWQVAAEKGEPWACFNLGLSYHLGKDTPVNPAEAIKWYRFASERGYAPAQANLGYCYDTGFGVPVDHYKAAEWYQSAALQGNAYAQYNLGKKYHAGPGIALDPKLAEKWLKQAAEQNFIPAIFSLGQIYAEEISTTPDFKKALHSFRMAAEQGYAAAQHAIGYMHFAGKGVQTNYFEAVKWYKLAASRNFADSHYNLSICYERGLGVPQNLTAAVNHYRTAAELGHRFAQYSLGVCYYEGKGVEVDLIHAYKWWNLAAVQGVPEAASSKRILSRLLTESQVKEGQQRANEFVDAFVVRASTPSDSLKLIQVASAEGGEIKKAGTGVMISSDGYLLTTLQTVLGGKNVQVVTEGGTFSAALVKTDQLNDIALFRISGVFQPLPLFSSRDVPVATEVLALGFDAENQGQFTPKAAHGKISSLLGFQADPRQFSLEPRVTSSFGGAALVNNRGQLVGMVLTEPGEHASTEARPNTNTSYALKSDHLMRFLRTVPEVKAIVESTKTAPELSASDVLSRARAATALVLVL